VRSSPPPDLGLPIAPADVGTASDRNGPPELDLELDHDAVTGEAAAANCAASLTSALAADSENGVIVIE